MEEKQIYLTFIALTPVMLLLLVKDSNAEDNTDRALKGWWIYSSVQEKEVVHRVTMKESEFAASRASVELQLSEFESTEFYKSVTLNPI